MSNGDPELAAMLTEIYAYPAVWDSIDEERLLAYEKEGKSWK